MMAMSMQDFEAQKANIAEEFIQKHADGTCLDDLKETGFMVMSGNPDHDNTLRSFVCGWRFNTANPRQVLETWTWKDSEWQREITPFSVLVVSTSHLPSDIKAEVKTTMETCSIGPAVTIGASFQATYAHSSFARGAAYVCGQQTASLLCLKTIDGKPV